MRLSVFSKFWLLQLQKSTVCSVKTIIVVFPKVKYLVSAKTFAWASGTLFGFFALFFSVSGILLYFDFTFTFRSKLFQYTAPVLFLDSNYYFSSKMASWGLNKSDIFLKAGAGMSHIKYTSLQRLVSFYFKSCTSYRFIDLLSKATINGLPAFDVFWGCFITAHSSALVNAQARSRFAPKAEAVLLPLREDFFFFLSYLQ